MPSVQSIRSSVRPNPPSHLTTGETMNILERIFGGKGDIGEVADDSRPVKLIPEGRNVWRVVYAD